MFNFEIFDFALNKIHHLDSYTPLYIAVLMGGFNINIDLIITSWNFGQWNIETLTGGGRWVVDGSNGALDFLTISGSECKSTSAGFFKELVNGNTDG